MGANSVKMGFDLEVRLDSPYFYFLPLLGVEVDVDDRTGGQAIPGQRTRLQFWHGVEHPFIVLSRLSHL